MLKYTHFDYLTPKFVASIQRYTDFGLITVAIPCL